MIAVRSLGSGSSGNAILIDTGDAVLLVDCGIGPRALAQELRPSGMRLADLDAVLLTHEHSDHVRALPQVLASQVPVIATEGTARRMRLPLAAWTPVRAQRPLTVAGLEVTALAVSHDAAEPCGFHLRRHEHAIIILTDLGAAHSSLLPYLAASDLIVLEANHDVDLLRAGPYPAHLKRRVLSATGHLSNADCGALLTTAIPDDGRPRTVWLAHLSATNNRPALAQRAVSAALATNGVEIPVVPLPRYGHDVEWRSAGVAPQPAQLGLGI